MKKIVNIIVSFLILLIGFYFIWWNLPLSINRHTDIKLGDKIIDNIEKYKVHNKLPDNDDWETLRKFGFRDKIDFLQPEYSKIDSSTFELIFIEGFDGPYLMWNSKERVWKKDYPASPQSSN